MRLRVKERLDLAGDLPDWEESFRACLMGGSQPAGSTTSTQQTQPWTQQQPYLEQGFQAAQNLYNNPSAYPQYFQGSTVSPFNTTENTGLQMATNLGEQGNSSVNAANSYLTGELSGNNMPMNNPYLNTMEGQAVGSVMPGLESQFAQGNAMNEPGAGYAVGQGVGNALGNVYGGMYQQDLQNNNAAAMFGAPAMQAAGYQNANMVLGAGQTQQQQAQNVLNSQIAQWNYNQTLPENMLNYYQGLIGGNYGSSSSMTTPYFEPSPIAGGMTGAMGGAATGAMLGSVVPGIGTAFGALAGGLLGGAGGAMSTSDRRAKHIGEKYQRAVDDLRTLEVVRARYRWEDQAAERPMLIADEVEDVLPGAVHGKRDAEDGRGHPIYQKIDPMQFVPVLVAAVKELDGRLKALEEPAHADA